ncbi:MAG: translation initiation factor IF-2 [Lentisphaeria bacterium]
MTPEKIRVYELARELGMNNKDLLLLLEKEGFTARSHSSSIDAEDADLVRRQIIAERQQQEEETQQVIDETPEAVAEEETPADEEAPAAKMPELHLKTPITVRDLAEALQKKPNELIGMLMTMNIFAAINQVLDVELVEQICERHQVKFVRERREKPQEKPVQPDTETGKGRPRRKVGRPPVVVFMGHVDHGKTSLQDYIRHTRVTKGESGGITQHMGASVAQVGEDSITFLDTPGHAAFTGMRARGANATDLAVLVVAATEGVMPQTVEAINHIRAAKVPIIVAMNKMDLPGANPDKVMLGLQQNNINPEPWGGDTAVIPVSALSGEGIDDLLERILLEAEMLELNADLNAPFEGLVIEAQMESGMGPTANILVRNGVLKVGDCLLCGQTYGRIKAIIDTYGKRLAKAGPSTPVKILGLSGVPDAGDPISSCPNEQQARSLAEEAMSAAHAASLQVERSVSLNNLDDWFSKQKGDEKPELALILKTDVRGSLEALSDSIGNLKSDRVSANIIHGGVGEITESDVVLAQASEAIILGFHVRVMPGISRLAKQKGIDIRLYSVIYELLDELKEAMRGRLAPEIHETPLGEAEILQVFNVSKAGRICGCRVQSGVIRINAKAKVYRDKELIYHGQVQTLKHFKEDVREIRSGFECGIRLDNFEDFEVGDRIEVFSLTQVQPEL